MTRGWVIVDGKGFRVWRRRRRIFGTIARRYGDGARWGGRRTRQRVYSVQYTVTTERTGGGGRVAVTARMTRTRGTAAGCARRVCFPLDAKRKRQGSTARNVSGARTHKKNGRQNPRASYFTVCQAVRGFYNITDKHLAKKNCAHQNGSTAAATAVYLRSPR